MEYGMIPYHTVAARHNNKRIMRKRLCRGCAHNIIITTVASVAFTLIVELSSTADGPPEPQYLPSTEDPCNEGIWYCMYHTSHSFCKEP